MARIFAGVTALLLLTIAAVFIWKAQAGAVDTALAQAPPRANGTARNDAPPIDRFDVGVPPQASEATREAKRFNRFDRNRDGAIAAEEYLQSRRKAYAKLDANGDGRLSFEEYATKAIDKFRSSDRDHSGQLNGTEFAATRPVRSKTRPARCPPPLKPIRDSGEDDG